MKTAKKLLSMLLAVMMIVSVIPMTSIEAEAAATKTQQQAVSWTNSRIGGTVKNMDGAAGYQCVDLVLEYYSFLGVSGGGGNACDYASNTSNTLPSEFTRIKDSYGFVPQPGDIAVWDVGYGELSYCGHVGIVISADLYNITIAEVWGNSSGTDGLIRKNTYPYNGGTYQHFWGVIRPKYASSTVETTAIALNASPFTLNVGESKTLSATVSPSNATNKTVTWSSNNTGVAKVSSSGVVTAVAAGACTITAKASEGQTASVIVVVRNEKIAPVAYTTYNDHYYELYEDVLSWQDAKEYCSSLGGHLVAINNSSENSFIQNFVKDSKRTQFYIGATDEATEGTWKWVTGQAFSYRNFADGEPSTTDYEVEDYLFLNSSTGKWHDIRNITGSIGSCGFVCEYEASLEPDAVTVIDGKFYELYDREYPIKLAENFANDNNGDLLTINSEKEQNAVASWIRANSSTKYVALGAYADSNRVWHWSNGDEWNYDNWRSGEPNNTNNKEDGATIVLEDNGWNDVSRTNAYVFVVEYSLYTIKYNANGGTGAPSSQIKTHGTALTLSATKPTRAGYTFLGWSTSSTATSATYSAGSSFTTDANTTLYAVWEKAGHDINNDGIVNSNDTGLYKYDGVWYYVKNGDVDYTFTGLVKHTNGVWYYVEDGVLDWSYSGLWKHNGVWYYVQKGQINWKFTGLVKHTNGTWYYVQGAKLDWGYTGLVKHTTGSWFYVQKGQINFDYTGLVKHTNGIWYYVQNGKLNWNKTGLVKHTDGNWYYVQKGQINWNYTGLVKHTNGTWYYVQKGKLNWKYTGYTYYNGKKYRVVNGVKI